MAFPSPFIIAVSNKAVLLASDLYCSKEYGWPSKIFLRVISGCTIAASGWRFCNLSVAKTMKQNFHVMNTSIYIIIQ